jgi:hypothetical protein
MQPSKNGNTRKVFSVVPVTQQQRSVGEKVFCVQPMSIC